MPNVKQISNEVRGLNFLRLKISVFLIVVCGFFGSPVIAAPDPEKARQFIVSGIARTIELLKGKDLSRSEIARRLRNELRRGFDIPTIAGYVLGPLRNQITPDQKRRYLHEFEELIVLTYTNRVFNVRPRIKSISPDIIQVTGSRPLGSDQLLVRSRVNRAGAKWIKIDWRLRQRNGQFLILDIMIIGFSQAQVYRDEFASVLRRQGGGVEGLIKALKKKNEALRNK